MPGNIIQLRVVTPEGNALDREVASVVLWTEMGEIEVLPGHSALVVMLQPGELRARDANGEEYLFAAGEGFAQIDAASVTVLTDLAEDASQITVETAQDAKRRAELAVAEASKLSAEEAHAADLALRESLVKIRLSTRRRRDGRPDGGLR